MAYRSFPKGAALSVALIVYHSHSLFATQKDYGYRRSHYGFHFLHSFQKYITYFFKLLLGDTAGEKEADNLILNGFAGILSQSTEE